MKGPILTASVGGQWLSTEAPGKKSGVPWGDDGWPSCRAQPLSSVTLGKAPPLLALTPLSINGAFCTPQRLGECRPEQGGAQCLDQMRPP